MVKYIIHGGYANHKNDDNDKYYKEILKTDKKELNILIVLFAKPEEENEKYKDLIIKQFNSNNNNDKKLVFDVAYKENFVEQIKKADIIFLHGGETRQLLNALKECDNFAELLKNKIVTGESAGAYVLSTCFYSKQINSCSNGLGLVPIKTICHYVGKNKNKLDSCSGNLEKLLLADYKYKIFEL